jgi:hypothetical protein
MLGMAEQGVKKYVVRLSATERETLESVDRYG